MRPKSVRSFLRLGAVIGVGSLILSACGGSGFEDDEGGATDPDQGGASEEGGTLTSSDDPLEILIGSSGEAETSAVEDAVAEWSKDSGVDAKVSVANDLPQQLSQGFAAGSPPDLFYLAPENLAGYAENGSLQPYGDELENKDDFYESLIENFTYNDEFYCAPKDFSTLALVINTDIWEEAGLSDSDYPQDWDDLTAVAKTLTNDDHVGLAFGAEFQRVGVFMAQAGGGLMSDDQANADSPENLQALEYVQAHLQDGVFAYASDIGAGWGGEALGKSLAAMVIEGNWITGAMENDFPDVSYAVVELPSGPGGQGTLQFTNCWGLAADSPNQQAAADLVDFLTSPEQQLAFSDAFGPMPSIMTAADQWTTDNPELEAFLTGADYAQFIPNMAGSVDVVADFNAQLESLESGGPKAILQTVQGNLEAIVD